MSNDISQVINQIVECSKDETLAPKINIAEIIRNIDVAYHRDWEKDKLEFARNLLSRTWAGIPLPVLSLCGRGTQEIRYSTYLAYFLDCSKPHGLGTQYLDGILDFLKYKNIDTYKSTVETEKWLGRISEKQEHIDCYCDIFVECENCSVFIEQKINSGESVNPRSKISQLLRYDHAIEKNTQFLNKQLIRIYLTPTGKISSKSPNWLSLSYIDLVKIGLSIINSGKISHTARENLKRFLLDILIGPFKKTEIEIQELVSLAEKAVTDGSFKNRLQFDQAVNRNNMLINILMEG